MEYEIIICIIIAICGITFGLTNYFYWRKSAKFQIRQVKEDKTKEIYNELKKKAEQKISSETERLQNVQSSLGKAINNLNQINNEINTKKSFNENLLKIREDELNRLYNTKKEAISRELKIEEENKKKELNKEIEEWTKSAQEAATTYVNLKHNELKEILEEEEFKLIDNLNTLQNEVNEFQEKRNALNNEILRQRALEEQQDFYRIQLDEKTIEDIALLETIRPRLSKIDLLDKLIYNVYIKGPTDEMIKRVLGGRAPSGIYKITRIKTGEVYIGMSTNVHDRWQQHSKTAFNCGTISHSTLHTVLKKDGIENFTWELLEEVPKDKLREREKYYINFYESQKYGLNQKVG